MGAPGDDNLNNQPHIHLISRGYLLGISPFKGLLGGDRIQIHSLKLTANAPENRPSEKETIVFQPSIFRCYVSFREGNHGSNYCILDDL